MKHLILRPASTALALALSLFITAAHAGRPLSVDDANVNDKGAGHVEVWMARDASKVSTWTVAPAYAPVENVELGVAFAKATKKGPSEQAIQAKWRITPSQENGCNAATTLGTVHQKEVGSSPYLVGIVTCNSALGALHVNLTRQMPKAEKAFSSWGVAFERPMGAITPHVEIFGDDSGKPTFQLGAKTDVADGIQLDATVGRDHQNRGTIFSLGFKISF